MTGLVVRRLALWVPLLGFFAFVALVVFGLGRSPQVVIESRLIGQPVPAFDLPGRLPGHAGLSTEDLKSGEPVLVNIFASWCIPCAVEAPQLGEMKKRGAVIHAVAVRDTEQAVVDFLARHGDPFERIAFDDRSRFQLSLGSSGVPETFIIDGDGIIRHQHIGEITSDDVERLMRELEKAR